ncbi:hypothetical protein KQ874_02985 [Mycoplasma sp. ES3157-GEN-MYC]|nr:hypothetical protein [Mycoplasma miroungigenitalium]MBU4690642.1 hypothetical protein [Mycoplasma miroungigenitalium]
MKFFSDTRSEPIYIYETYTSNDKVKLSNISRAKLLIKIIKNFYLINKHTQIYVLSDGAKYFENLAKILNAKHIFDYFHFKKRFNDLFKKPIFIYNENKMNKKLLKINNLSAKQWMLKVITNKELFIDRLKILKKYDFVNIGLKNNINTFINFIRRTCKDYNFYINNITCEAESSISLFKSFYKKRYSTFSRKTIIALINANKVFSKWKLVNIFDVRDENLIWEKLSLNYYRFSFA